MIRVRCRAFNIKSLQAFEVDDRQTTGRFGYSVVTEEKGEDDETPAGGDVQGLVQQ